MNTPAPSPKLTIDQMHAVLTDWHAHYADDELYNFLSVSFEDMADNLSRAEKCVVENQEEAAWLANQQAASQKARYEAADRKHQQRRDDELTGAGA